MLIAEHLSPKNVANLFNEHHFANVTSKMSELGKSFLRFYLSVVTNAPIIEKFLEQMLAVSQNPKDTNIAPETLSNLEMVTGTVNCLQSQALIAKQDLYLLMFHPNVGNALYNQFHRETHFARPGTSTSLPLKTLYGPCSRPVRSRCFQ